MTWRKYAGYLMALLKAAPPPSETPRMDVGIALWADGKTVHHEIPHVHHQVIFKAARLAVEEETAGW